MTLLRCVLAILSLLGVWHSLMARQAISITKNPFQYSAMYTDNESRLQYLNARYYDPDTGEFIQWDTYSEDDKSSLFDNRYNYGGGDPINNSDPSGHCIFPAGTGPFKDIVQAFDPYVPGDPLGTLVNTAMMGSAVVEEPVEIAESYVYPGAYSVNELSEALEQYNKPLNHIIEEIQSNAQRVYQVTYNLNKKYGEEIATEKATRNKQATLLRHFVKTLSTKSEYRTSQDIKYVLKKLDNSTLSIRARESLSNTDYQRQVNIARRDNGLQEIAFPNTSASSYDRLSPEYRMGQAFGSMATSDWLRILFDPTNSQCLIM